MVTPNSLKDFTYRQLISYGKAKLSSAYRQEAVLLLCVAADCSKETIYCNMDTVVDDETVEKYRLYVERRNQCEPIQYIAGKWPFMGLEFQLNRHVLIPRPDTECLVEQVIKIVNEKVQNKIEDDVRDRNRDKIRDKDQDKDQDKVRDNVRDKVRTRCAVQDCNESSVRNVNVLELCTGTGCIAVSLAHYIKNVRIVATDISEEALAVAAHNAAENQVADKITFLFGDLFEPLLTQVVDDYYNDDADERFDILCANPPYIPQNEIETLIPDVREFEPILALDGGGDGLDFYRRIAAEAEKVIKEDACIIMEVGFGQAEQVAAIFRDKGYGTIWFVKDLSGIERIVCAAKILIDADKVVVL